MNTTATERSCIPTHRPLGLRCVTEAPPGPRTSSLYFPPTCQKVHNIIQFPVWRKETAEISLHSQTSLFSAHNQNCLLVIRLNDNHSSGPGLERLVPISHQIGELSDAILSTFSRGNKSLEVHSNLQKEPTLTNIRLSNEDQNCHRNMVSAGPNWGG